MFLRVVSALETSAKYFVAGHRGLVGSAIVRELQAQGCHNIITASRDELDLRNEAATREFVNVNKPDYVFLAAAVVGGIQRNSDFPVAFLLDNLRIQNSVVAACADNAVRKLVFLGSSCIYPRLCEQPMKEDYLMTGPLEPTNEWYALAKIAGLKLCQAYRKERGFDYVSVMPTNLYGPNDDYSAGCHVIPALIARFHAALVTEQTQVTVWGSPTTRREFLYIDDLAKACVLVLREYSASTPINIGYGSDISMGELAEHVARAVGLKAKIVYDTSKPSGTPRKLLDSSRIFDLGWKPETTLDEGLPKSIKDYLSRFHSDKKGIAAEREQEGQDLRNKMVPIAQGA